MLGKKVYGFKFENHNFLKFSSLMEKYVGKVGLIVYEAPNINVCRVRFNDDEEWLYPSEMIQDHLVDESYVEGSFDTNIKNVIRWAGDRSLLSEYNAPKQMLKVVEEVGETASALLKKDREALIDGIGDSFITLIILSAQLGLSPAECLNSAWNEIKNRSGKLVDGTFIKDF